MHDACQKFMTLIKEEKFYDAHEALEEVWFPRRKSKDTDVLVLKGFINASVALELKRLGRDANALKVWQNYLKYRPLIKECNENIFYEIEDFLDSCYDKYLS
ncbi:MULTISPECIES: DUF309 domain-containing protein [Nitratiruptor]|uniref:DUF309 domain-containing protein n=1 Tax=Nitratiruptor tergarcus DSM 16512 TaxID=1069081 RepID=A0A1W1WR62_9BACT|nr:MULTISPECIES: DUF309 domain-containing protein [Nitratiruptor]BCD61188.1 hypothetical protein NitYY0813_C0021 [Nitratiruptor sp. YY08-13]BCD65121.1 hypothetical protein NitYY0826_C0021 [Nitratiruptor sp. YY08-26]SMC08699.1 protein of unknown function [Nitratiruptor tergarcus DSM 16512]